MQACTRCGRVLPKSEFWSASGNRPRYWCRECENERRRENRIPLNPDMTYGIEIEVFAPGCEPDYEAARMLQSKGIDAQRESYNHDVRSHWKVTYDADVAEYYCGSGECVYGYEINSPVLHGPSGMRQLKVVLDTLKEQGAWTNINCGLHVHHGIDRPMGMPTYDIDWHSVDGKQLRNAMLLYYDYEEAFDRLVPYSRRTGRNDRCSSIGTVCGYWGIDRQEFRNRLVHCDTVHDVLRLIDDRYITLNPRSVRRQGTIEFRQQGSTLDYDTILHWVALTQRIVEWAKDGTPAVKRLPKDNVKALFATIGLNRRSRKWFYAHMDAERSEYDTAYVPDCVSPEGSNVVECYECGDRIDADEAYEDSCGNQYCCGCYSDLYFACEICGEESSRDEFTCVGGYYACESCTQEYEDAHQTCEVCGGEYHTDEITSIDGAYDCVCEVCAEEWEREQVENTD